MKKFMDEDFLLQTQTSKELYNKVKNLSIIDYHCHINPKEIAENKKYTDITEVMLGGDHYKWRAMRNCGIDEKFITGDGTSFEKFLNFAKIMPSLIGNPLYHWTHLELKKYFGIEEQLFEDTAKEIYDKCNEKLNNMSVTDIINMSNVEVVCTTDDPDDNLEHHKKIKNDGVIKTKVLPTFRPDRLLKTFDKNTLKHLEKRLDYFVENGCKLADHGVYNFDDDITNMLEVGKLYKERDITLQIHYGVSRNPNSKMFKSLGPDTGFDVIGNSGKPDGLLKFLDNLLVQDKLPKIILYSINPSDNLMLSTVAGSFPNVKHGTAWWFNDTKIGMENHMKELASVNALGKFLGMLTDSRSFLSYTRHDYFRRILCNYIGELVENGEYHNNINELEKIVTSISYNNAKKFLNL